jgi:DNA-binding NarL/FixJ family response regulator
MNPIRVVLVDDHALFRTGVVAALGDAVDIVGEADDIDSGISEIRRTRPDVVLLDVHLTSGSGVEVILPFADDLDQVRFLALSVSDAPEDVLALVRAGARGYITKRIDGADLVDAVQRVAGGDAVFSPRLAGFVLDAFARTAPVDVAAEAETDSDLDRLSPREQEVMRSLARGYAYKEIAREMGISIRTVESHTSSVLRKLQLSNRHELTHWAAHRRLV